MVLKCTNCDYEEGTLLSDVEGVHDAEGDDCPKCDGTLEKDN